jgi:hypothetical protein
MVLVLKTNDNPFLGATGASPPPLVAQNKNTHGNGVELQPHTSRRECSDVSRSECSKVTALKASSPPVACRIRSRLTSHRHHREGA